MSYFVYFLSNYRRNVLYIGITNDLRKRIEQHRNENVRSFTAKYHVTDLVYFEEFSEIIDAISREKQLKGWRRSKKEMLINSVNPERKDVSDSIPL